MSNPFMQEDPADQLGRWLETLDLPRRPSGLGVILSVPDLVSFAVEWYRLPREQAADIVRYVLRGGEYTLDSDGNIWRTR